MTQPTQQQPMVAEQAAAKSITSTQSECSHYEAFA